MAEHFTVNENVASSSLAPGALKPLQKSGRRYGGFDVLRIVAALAVILNHSFALTGNARDRISFFVGHHRVPLGTLGVSVFFVTSGFLVAGSWDRVRSARVFVRHRVARIWPAITMVVVLTVFVMGPLLTEVSLAD